MRFTYQTVGSGRTSACEIRPEPFRFDQLAGAGELIVWKN